MSRLISALLCAALLSLVFFTSSAESQPQQVRPCIGRVDANGSNQCTDVGISTPFPVGGIVVASCGADTLTPGASATFRIDATGRLCDSSSGGGGGGAVTMAPGAVSTGAYQTGAFAVPVYLSGAYASGSIGSGAMSAGSYAVGALPSGAIADGGIAALGTTTDAACAGDTSTCTIIAQNKRLLQLIDSALPAGTAIIGQVGIDQTTVGTTNNVTVSPLPRTARNFPGATVGASSAQALAASTAVKFLQIQNTHASNTVACAFGATAVLNSSTSVQLAAGQSASWGPLTGGVPTGALNCIASGASTPLYVEWL